MKKFPIKSIKFLIIIIFTIFGSRASASVFINEIAWMGTATNSSDEWIELKNDGDGSVDLTGWTLSALDGTPNIVLDGSISSSGFFLLERTDDQTVPNITMNQSYTGALLDSGEDLILKNSSGETIDSYYFSSGWPAGDSSTKDTMQWNGSSWITGSSTPKENNVSVGSSSGNEEEENEENDNEEEDDSDYSSSASSSKPKIPPTLSIRIKTKGNLFSGEEIFFYPEVMLSDGKIYKSGFVEWSFGDGSREVLKASDPVSHIYSSEGNYVVVANYRKSTSFLTETDASSRITLSIKSSNVVMTPLANGDFVIENKTGKEIDISFWKIVSSNGEIFYIPKDTIILGNSKITIPLIYTNFSTSAPHLESFDILFDNDNLAYSYSPQQKIYTSKVKNTVASNPTEIKSIVIEEEEKKDFVAIDINTLKVEAESTQNVPFVFYLLGTIFVAVGGVASIILFKRERLENEDSSFDFEIKEKE